MKLTIHYVTLRESVLIVFEDITLTDSELGETGGNLSADEQAGSGVAWPSGARSLCLPLAVLVCLIVGWQPCAGAEGDQRIELRTKAIVPTDPKQAIVQFQVRYQNRDAGEVQFVWGLNNFTHVPAKLPAETFLTYNDSHMNTPMRREGDMFVFEFEVAANTRLDYGFMVVRTRTNKAAKIWVGATPQGDYYKKTLTVEHADEKIVDPRIYVGQFRSPEWSELRTTAIVPADPKQAIIRFQVRYCNPNAAEVRLVWGLNNFTHVPAERPPETFLTYGDSHMNTPMRRDGDVFVFEFEVAANTRLDYAFATTRSVSGEAVELWQGATPQGDYFTRTLTASDSTVTVAANRADRQTALETLGSELSREAALPSADLIPHPTVDSSQMEESVQILLSAAPRGQSVEPRIQVQARYHNPIADEVILVWGLNDYKTVPGKLPAETVLTYNNTHMNTPMLRSDGDFVMDIDVKQGTKLHYAFLITRLSDGQPAKMWRFDRQTGKEYMKMISIADVTTLGTRGTGWSHGSRTLQLFGVGVLIAMWVVFELRRGRRTSRTGTVVNGSRESS